MKAEPTPLGDVRGNLVSYRAAPTVSRVVAELPDMTLPPEPAPPPSRLAACPFCGLPDGVPRKSLRTIAFYVWCESCHARGPLSRTLEGAVRLWNERG